MTPENWFRLDNWNNKLTAVTVVRVSESSVWLEGCSQHYAINPNAHGTSPAFFRSKEPALAILRERLDVAELKLETVRRELAAARAL